MCLAASNFLVKVYYKANDSPVLVSAKKDITLNEFIAAAQKAIDYFDTNFIVHKIVLNEDGAVILSDEILNLTIEKFPLLALQSGQVFTKPSSDNERAIETFYKIVNPDKVNFNQCPNARLNEVIKILGITPESVFTGINPLYVTNTVIPAGLTTFDDLITEYMKSMPNFYYKSLRNKKNLLSFVEPKNNVHYTVNCSGIFVSSSTDCTFKNLAKINVLFDIRDSNSYQSNVNMHTLQFIGCLYNSNIPFIFAICNMNVYYEIWLYRENKVSKFHNLNENEFFGYISYYLSTCDTSITWMNSNCAEFVLNELAKQKFRPFVTKNQSTSLNDSSNLGKKYLLNKEIFSTPPSEFSYRKDLSQSMFISNIYLNSKKIGKGRNGYVHKFKQNYKSYVLKVCKIWKKGNQILNELINEVKIYEHLKEKEVKCVPELIFANYFILENKLHYAIALTYIDGISIPFNEMNDYIKNKCIKCLASVHAANIHHGDIRYQNFLFTDHDENIFVIDFGFSTINNNSLIVNEMDKLKRILFL